MPSAALLRRRRCRRLAGDPFVDKRPGARGLGIGWARVYVGMHQTIDVVAGLAMGVASVVLAVEVLRPRLVRTPTHA